MKLDITPALAAMLARNRGLDPRAPETWGDRQGGVDYGVRAALDGGVVEFELTFRAGSPYCCMEWGCHLGLLESRWTRLRLSLTEHGIEPPPCLELHLTVVVEDGALFFDPSRPDPTRLGWYELRPAGGQRYEATRREANEPT
jgi:hypothetical protein